MTTGETTSRRRRRRRRRCRRRSPVHRSPRVSPPPLISDAARRRLTRVLISVIGDRALPRSGGYDPSGQLCAKRDMRSVVSVTEEYLANNVEYAKTFTGPLPMPPSKHVAVVACMDARLDVYRILGLKDGEAHVIRNAGESSPTTIRSLAISQRTARYQGDHPHPPHRLRHADVHRRRLQTRSAGRDRYQAGWAAESFPDVEEDVPPVPAAHRAPARSSPNTSVAWVRLRCRDRQAPRGRSFHWFLVVPTPSAPVPGTPCPGERCEPHGHHGSTGRRRQSLEAGHHSYAQERVEVERRLRPATGR